MRQNTLDNRNNSLKYARSMNKSQRKKEGKPVEEGEKKKPESKDPDEEQINRMFYNDPMPDHRREKGKLGEGNCPACEGKAPKSECKCGTMKESELTAIKKNQDSITSLNENRLLNINKELMRRLIK